MTTILSGSPETWAVQHGTSLSIGVFDGVHRGHRDLLQKAFAGGGIPSVVTFDPHPIEILAHGISPRLLTTLDERVGLFQEIGVELVAVLNLEDVRYLEPGDFARSILLDRLGVSTLTVGSDFHFGRDRAGDAAFLRAFGHEHGITVNVVDLVDVADEPISSSRIRDMVEFGDVSGAAAMMGSRFRMTNTVVHGDKRGRSIGFPTANLVPVDRKCLPADGVYATMASIGGASYPAATNVGVRPTFGGGQRLVEAYILDFDGDIYGEQLTVEFVERLRPELKFESVDDLVSKMSEDVADTRTILSTFTG